ncbi:tyrosine-protein phosphatase non-receptor type 14 [Euwallacea fornicatus]|uniref:tyrosine-protein phosphatase non-receptor type 14 n=1 Tax=Euwallacea fornicatus TaxID=995702 RepID=UPI00338F7CD0
MPFKLKLKKSRHYSVVSKSLFVISVEILDGTNVECTLSSESTGQDCLDIVCQKLGLNQLKFFGLQYVSCHSEHNLCWLELDKPMKRQLDKHARALSVHLRVMYYVTSGVRLITDEVTRYHYFLQLKQDVIEGRWSCTPQQAIELASYCMQAEFGNFDSERHTGLYLKEFQLFPKAFTDPITLESLTEAASRQHAALHNLPQSTAEEYYICACQKLEAYGEEEFQVKEKEGNIVMIGIGLTGVSVTYGERNSRHFVWSDISNVINHKKEFIIESVGGVDKVEFFFPDVDSAKHSWRFCVLQHMFFRQYEMNNEIESDNRNTSDLPAFQQAEDPREMESCEDMAYPSQRDTNFSSQNLSQRAQSTSCLDLHASSDRENLRSLLPSYRPAPDYETAVQQKYRNSSSALLPPNEPHTMIYSSQPEIHQSDAYSAHLRYPDLTHNTFEQKGMYPGFVESPPFVYGNDSRQVNFDNVGIVHLYNKQPPPYPVNRIGSNSTPDLAGISQQAKFPNMFVNNLISGSSPDLVSSDNRFVKRVTYQAATAHPIHRSHSYLPQQQSAYENVNSIFNYNFTRPQQALIVENPNVTKHIKKVYDEHGNIIYCLPANMKQILQTNKLPNNGFVVMRNPKTLVPHDAQVSNSSEPIYENLPMTWQNDTEMRSRAQSIHSAPDISQVVNHSLVNALQSQLQTTGLNRRENVYANIGVNVTNNEAENNKHDLVEPNISAHSDNLVIAHSNNNKESFRTSSVTISSDKTENSTVSAGSFSNVDETVSNASLNSSSSKTKKKRWGLLMGKKSEVKVKSATLKMEKKREDKGQGSAKHRWSTGQPKFNPLPPSISKETMCQLLENKLADSQLFFEFDKIPKKKDNADFMTALLPENAIFNRFKDILPYEDNRLRLTPSKGNKYGYINASHITATVGSKQRFYIAGQGPTRATLPYFWQCIWEAEVYLLVQLTDHTEDLSYLPDADDRCINVGKDYQVWWEFSQKTGYCITSKIRLCQVVSRRYRTMWHLHYTDWGDQGCPNSVSHFLGFLEEMQSVYQHSMNEIPPGHNKNPPILVHCTAGVGRTGLTILSDLLLYTVDHNQEVCIPGVVGLLRQQRPQMVQTIAQYRFVYSVLIHYLKQTRLI